MIVSCEACKARYKLDDSKIAGKGAKITCPKCKNVFVVHLDEVDEPTNFPVRPPIPAPIVPQEPEKRLEAPTEERAAKGDVSAKAALLDFKKVGVAAWKVKVKIGLIYDFADIKTLRKYMQDGRVTNADVISYDGKAWRQIGEIPDLDVFFIETWERLEAEMKDAPPPVAAPKAPPSDDALAAMAAAAAAAEEPEAGPAKGAPKPAPRPRPSGGSARPPRPDASGGGTSKALIAAIALVVVVGGAYAFLGGKGAETVESAAPPPKTAAPAPTPVPAVSDAAKMEAEMKALRAQSEAARAPVAAAADDHLLTPVDRSAAVPIDRPMNAGGTPVAAPTAPTTQAKASSASDHESVGDDAARSGDWSMAAMAYKKAAAMDARSAKLQLKLGEALLKSGDSNGAMGPLGTAGAGGQARAWKLLGDAARAQGDAAGANSYYQKYLATNPSDAAAVRSLLGGG